MGGYRSGYVGAKIRIGHESMPKGSLVCLDDSDALIDTATDWFDLPHDRQRRVIFPLNDHLCSQSNPLKHGLDVIRQFHRSDADRDHTRIINRPSLLGCEAAATGRAEIARIANAGREKKANLTAVELQGWSRDMHWADTGLPWVNPSPNLRSSAACLAYPGTCLLEGTTVTEGRGTDAPFLKVGAPWLKAAELAQAVRVPGFLCKPTTFTPRSSAAARSPKYLDVPCQGLEIRVSDATKAEPYRLGVTLLVEMKKRHPEFGWRGDGSGFDRLVGTRSLRTAIERGDSVDAIVAADLPAIEQFRGSRSASLLY